MKEKFMHEEITITLSPSSYIFVPFPIQASIKTTTTQDLHTYTHIYVCYTFDFFVASDKQELETSKFIFKSNIEHRNDDGE